jgi:hypothetical protein
MYSHDKGNKKGGAHVGCNRGVKNAVAAPAQLKGEIEGVLLCARLEHNAVPADDHEAAIAQVGCMQHVALQHHHTRSAGALHPSRHRTSGFMLKEHAISQKQKASLHASGMFHKYSTSSASFILKGPKKCMHERRLGERLSVGRLPIFNIVSRSSA